VNDPPWHVQIGPFTRLIAEGAKWLGKDRFPARQVWADEVERILEFLSAQDQFLRFLPRLRDDARARDAALAEARVAFLLHRNGFRIVEWEPAARNRHKGDFSIQWNNGPVILVEVKAPDWQSELTDPERRGERKELGKYVDQECRSVDIRASPLMEVIAKNAVPKLSADRPNLVATKDDFLIPAVDRPGLDDGVEQLLRQPQSHVLGGLLCLKAESSGNEIRYTIRFFANPYANAACRIPTDVATALTAISQTDAARL
jgi:hypothetical protein